MKKIIFTASVLLNMVWFIAADFKAEPVKTTPVIVKKKTNCGYTIIEFGKGVDCHGDTIKLAKVNGVQVRVDS